MEDKSLNDILKNIDNEYSDEEYNYIYNDKIVEY